MLSAAVSMPTATEHSLIPINDLVVLLKHNKLHLSLQEQEHSLTLSNSSLSKSKGIINRDNNYLFNE